MKLIKDQSRKFTPFVLRIETPEEAAMLWAYANVPFERIVKEQSCDYAPYGVNLKDNRGALGGFSHKLFSLLDKDSGIDTLFNET